MSAHGYAGDLGNTTAAALVFWALAAGTLGGSLFVITRRNLITAVMGMVGTFFCISALYALLYAHFLAVIQVLVYAGAIMVLFVFVVMILNREEEQPWAIEGLFGKAVAGGALAYLVFRLGHVLWQVKDAPVAAADPVDPIGVGEVAYPWGSTRALARVLFTDYLFPFEAVSIVLLVAVIGAIFIARAKTVDTGANPEGNA